MQGRFSLVGDSRGPGKARQGRKDGAGHDGKGLRTYKSSTSTGSMFANNWRHQSALPIVVTVRNNWYEEIITRILYHACKTACIRSNSEKGPVSLKFTSRSQLISM